MPHYLMNFLDRRENGILDRICGAASSFGVDLFAHYEMTASLQRDGIRLSLLFASRIISSKDVGEFKYSDRGSDTWPANSNAH